MTTDKKIAVVILNWNGEKLLKEYLPQVIATTDSKISQIIVADNGSTDGSVELLRSSFPEVELMLFDRNYGFAEGYNRAIAAVEHYPYAVLLNSDLATSEGWDRILLDYMDSHPNVGAVQPKLLAYRNKDTFEYAGASGGFIDCNGYPYCRGRIFDTCEKDQGQYDQPMNIFWASGACLMTRPQLYLEAGGLDREFFAHMEEIDLCWRIKLLGYDIAVVPQAKVYHLGGGSLPAENPRKTYLNFRNNLLMLYKNLPKKEAGAFLVRRRLLDTIAWIKYMLSFDFANANAILKAHRDYARMKKMYQPMGVVNLLKQQEQGRVNILLSYFLKGRRRYSDLGFKE